MRSTETVRNIVRKTATYQRPFLVRPCRIWNFLVDELVDFNSVTIVSFKSVLLNYYKTSVVTVLLTAKTHARSRLSV